MTKTKQHKCNNAQEILLDGCHLLFEEYLWGQYQVTGIFSSEHPVSLTEKTIFQKAWNSLSHFYQRGKCFEESLQGGKDVNMNILSE